MFRKDLIDTLRVRPITLYELSLLLEAEPRDLADDLQHHSFRLRDGDGGVYVVRQDSLSSRWEPTLFDSGRRDETRLFST